MEDRSILAYASGAVSFLCGTLGAWVPNVALADVLTLSGIFAATASTLLATQQIIHNHLDRREKRKEKKSKS